MKKVRNVLLILAFALIATIAKSQIPNNWFSPAMLFDTTIVDKEGNRYTLDQLRIDTVTLNGGQRTQLIASSSCTNTYFNLYYEPGCGMASTTNTTEIARRNVIEQLFCDLSAFITNHGGLSNKVNIWIRDPNLIIPSASSSGIVAAGSGFYTYPFNTGKLYVTLSNSNGDKVVKKLVVTQ